MISRVSERTHRLFLCVSKISPIANATYGTAAKTCSKAYREKHRRRDPLRLPSP